MIIALVAALAWVWLAQDDDSGRELGVTVEDIAEEEAFDDDGFAVSLVGRTVTVSGSVSEVLSEGAFRIGGDDFGGAGVLVVGTANGNVEEGEDVRITGTVREFDAAALESEFGFDLGDDSLYDIWEDENVLVATDVSELRAN